MQEALYVGRQVGADLPMPWNEHPPTGTTTLLPPTYHPPTTYPFIGTTTLLPWLTSSHASLTH